MRAIMLGARFLTVILTAWCPGCAEQEVEMASVSQAEFLATGPARHVAPDSPAGACCESPCRACCTYLPAQPEAMTDTQAEWTGLPRALRGTLPLPIHQPLVPPPISAVTA